MLQRIPDRLNSNPKAIIMLHGVGSNAADLFWLASHFDENTSIFSINGPFDLGHGRYAWYPLGFSNGKPVYDFSDVEIGYESIVTFIREMQSKYAIAQKNTYLFGFSQGAIMSYNILIQAPELIGGIIALSGRLLTELSDFPLEKKSYENKKVFIGHGVFDPVIPVDSISTIEAYLGKMWITPTVRRYSAPHTITEEEMQDIVDWLEG